MMQTIERYRKIFSLFLLCGLLCVDLSYAQTNVSNSEAENDDLELVHEESADTSKAPEPEEQDSIIARQQEPRKIKDIIITGNKYTSTEAILSYIPFKTGEVFNPQKSRQLIRNLYYGLKRFRNIEVKVENIGTDLINLHVIVEEKPVLKEVILEGNKQIGTKEINQKVKFDLPAIEEGELKILAQQIKKLYVDKGFFQTTIDTELEIDDDSRAIAIFTIHENKKSLVKRIKFTGNDHVPAKALRDAIFTKEDWIVGFLDKSGTYHPERIDADKHMIEQYYQNHGYLNAKVTDVVQDMDPVTKNIALTFDIEEGALYTIKEVQAPGNDILSEKQILDFLPLHVGDIYSREAIADSIKTLELLWGNYGHIFAHIEPSIQPDEETKTVSIAFYSELGDKIHLNKINIKGNQKTRDKVIRRKILLEEGELLTNSLMEMSKHSIESLGYFDPREGVNWKVRRLGEGNADLDLIVREIKTGNFSLQMGFGGAGVDLRSPNSGFNLKIGASDRNLFGSGINFNLEATWAKNEQTVLFHLGQPWLFDRPISAAIDFYHKRPTFDMLNNLDVNAVNEKLTGISGTVGFIPRTQNPFFNGTSVLFSLGIDDIRYETLPKASFSLTPEEKRAQYESLLSKQFVNGKFVWFANSLEQDMRNHPIHTSRGHRWALISKIAAPSLGSNIGFYKLGLTADWFTPIIGEYDLVFRLHGYLGLTGPFKNRNIPFDELFHIGGPASVRGFLFGQIGPKFDGDTIGSSKALFWNAELIFPITPDMNMKGAVFYDGGAGFDNPYLCEGNISRKYVTGNNFDYRHSVGFGIRLLNPMPIKIDWGFKIDPRKGESSHEVHFGATYDW